MTVAAQEALMLQACLSRGPENLARRFFKAAARIVDIPWDIAAAHDGVLAVAFLEVVNLMRAPLALLGPAIAWWVWCGNRRRDAAVMPKKGSSQPALTPSFRRPRSRCAAGASASFGLIPVEASCLMQVLTRKRRVLRKPVLEETMRKFLSAVPFVAIAFAMSPASAASMSCSGDGLSKASAAVSANPIGTPARMAGDKQLAMANSAMSKGDMRGCNKALAGIKSAKK